jgi:hypothetical protein
MAHHQLIGFVGLAVLVWVLTLQPALLKRWRLVLLCVAVFVAGFLPYVYLPIRARANPAMNWDHPTSLSAAWAHATRQGYGTLGPTAAAEPRSLSRLGAQFAYMGAAIAEDLTPWLAAAAVLGLLVLAGRDRPVLLLALLWLVCTGPLFVLVANFDLDSTTRWLIRVFLIPAPMALTIGFGYLLEWVRTRMHAKLSRTPRVAAAVVALLAIAGPAVQAASHWQRCDYSNYWYARDHAAGLSDNGCGAAPRCSPGCVLRPHPTGIAGRIPAGLARAGTDLADQARPPAVLLHHRAAFPAAARRVRARRAGVLPEAAPGDI